MFDSFVRNKKKSGIRICLQRCRYNSVRRVAKEIGMQIVDVSEQWDIFWSDTIVDVTSLQFVTSWQKYNHFYGMTELCRKDSLSNNLRKLAIHFPEEYDFFPKTWCTSTEIGRIKDYMSTGGRKVFICKPVCSSQGRGIFVTHNPLRHLSPQRPLIIQEYIKKPKLLDGFKFDLRIYVLIQSYDPLRIYIYKEGLARLATVKYKVPTKEQRYDTMMHLTNYSVQKKSENFIRDEHIGSKRRMTNVIETLRQSGVDAMKLLNDIDDLIIKTLICPYNNIKHIYNVTFPCHTKASSACFEILGFDVLLNENNKPYLLEVNHSPSLITDSDLDMEIKDSLIRDTLILLNMQVSKQKILLLERERLRKRELMSFSDKYCTLRNDADYVIRVDELYDAQLKFEEKNCGNFRKIYPMNEEQKRQYEKFILPTEQFFPRANNFGAKKIISKKNDSRRANDLKKDNSKTIPMIIKNIEPDELTARYNDMVASGVIKAVNALIDNVRSNQKYIFY